MKTPDEIKKGLANAEHVQRMAIVSEDGSCETNYGVLVGYVQRDDIVACIDNLVQRLAQAERERDALAYDMHQLQGALCAYCENLHKKDGAEHASCKVFGDDYGMTDGSPLMCGKFKWRGVCKENSKEDEANEGRT